MAERCFWCNTDPDEAAKRFEGPHATWCVHYSNAVAKQPLKWIAESNPRACAADVGFGMRCRREAGHAGFHTWDPKTLVGEEPVYSPSQEGVGRE